MAKESQPYSIEDWIVHLYHGVGQVVDIEAKSLDGKKKDYYKVKTKDSTYWILVEKSDNFRIRPLSTPREINNALRLMKRKPSEMSDDHLQRKSQINEVKADGSLKSVAKIIRDLSARQANEKLNDSEERALNQFINRLTEEWSESKGISPEDARQMLFDMFQKILA